MHIEPNSKVLPVKKEKRRKKLAQEEIGQT